MTAVYSPLATPPNVLSELRAVGRLRRYSAAPVSKGGVAAVVSPLA